MKHGDTCEVCGKSAMVQVGTEDSGACHHYCFNCHNREMAMLYDTDMPDYVPERLSFPGRNGKIHEFDIEFIIFGTGKSLRATEAGKTRRRADVWGSLDDSFDDMLDLLYKRIKKALSVKYMDQHGLIDKQKMVGYIEYDSDLREHVIYVDGKRYTWDEIGQNISSYEGWKIKIEFVEAGKELD